ncbi:DUF2333 family protein [Litorivicinus lipolyticus]|uniref:DUF2333 family protein n=1 Tax=Litorivicinus lipolyticus TaxID=418701 RepID=A0A5Q2QGT5_9GAMM|nr:DUF2333 family protein [Litorivicinus lipolyticus]QGG81050.1 DUF2333 family protein [Litorivicinus lipolyticus]
MSNDSDTILNAVNQSAKGRRLRVPIKAVAILLGVLLIMTVVLGVWFSREPERFEVAQIVAATHDGRAPKSGSLTTGALLHITRTLLEKPGGYLSNDIIPPGIVVDNMPNFEWGALVQARDLARALRKDFSRSQSQSTENEHLVVAEPALNFDSEKWFPSAEGSYSKAERALTRYLDSLLDPSQPDAQFFARADNLRGWLSDVETRLGSLSQRLSASVGQVRINTDLAGDSNAEQSTPAPAVSMVKTPWLEIDDVFYEARGSAWALIQVLRAIEVDFAGVLDDKNARASVRQIIRELEATQDTVWSPIIMNGSGFGMFANHSLVMASYISRAHSAMTDLRSLLSEG